MNEKSNPLTPPIGVTFFILNRWVNARVKKIRVANLGGEGRHPFDGRYKPHRELITGKVLPGLWRTAKAPTAFLMLGIAMLLIAGGSLLGCLRVMIVNIVLEKQAISAATPPCGRPCCPEEGR